MGQTWGQTWGSGTQHTSHSAGSIGTARWAKKTCWYVMPAPGGGSAGLEWEAGATCVQGPDGVHRSSLEGREGWGSAYTVWGNGTGKGSHVTGWGDSSVASAKEGQGNGMGPGGRRQQGLTGGRALGPWKAIKTE